MKKLLGAALAVASLALACGGNTQNPDPDAGTNTGTDAGTQPQTLAVTADITADTTWETGNTYVLEKHVFVKNATLTIQQGVTVKGKEGTSLVVTQSGKLEAVGTKEAPIVFTSAMAEGEREPGDWGGVVLLGKAKINVAGGTNKVEGFPADPNLDTNYGGTDDAHDCGTLQYARIEYAGYQLAPDNELNGLTVAGCGTGTTLDFIQIHKGADDGVEFFGGTAGISHLVITQPDDDGLDWDFGWTGKAQFLIVQQNELVGNCAFESDNNKNNVDAEPRSSPEIWNATLIGSGAAPGQAGKTQLAMHLKNGTAGKLNNFVIAHFADLAIDVEDKSTGQTGSVEELNAGNLFVKSSVFFDLGGQLTAWPAEASNNDGDLDEGAKIMDAANGNEFVDPKLVDARNLTAPNFKPAPDSTLVDPARAGTPGAGFDATAKFRGAIGTADWTEGWTAYPEK